MGAIEKKAVTCGATPVRTSSSATWSRLALSDSPELHNGRNSSSRPPHTGLDS